MSSQDIVGLCSLVGASKLRARWLRLVLLIVPAGPSRNLTLQALLDFPDRACTPLPPPSLFRIRCEHPAESFARSLLEREAIPLFVLGELLELLPAGDRKRFGNDNAARYWTTGLYVHGPHCGLRTATTAFPYATALVRRCVREAAEGFPFTSVALLEQVESSPHTDLNNHPGWPNLVLPLGPFTGGEVWVEDGVGPVAQVFGGKTRYGRLIDVARGPALFSGQRAHCTMPWEGTRRIAVAFSIRDLQRLSPKDRRRALEIGFPLPRANSSYCPTGYKGFDFDATLGYPGEGPFALSSLILLVFLLSDKIVLAVLAPRNAADTLRAAKRSPSGLRSGRVVLQFRGRVQTGPI